MQVFVRIRPKTDDEDGRREAMGVSIEDVAMTQVNILVLASTWAFGLLDPGLTASKEGVYG